MTGRDRLVSNAFYSWAAYFVFIVAGFVMPRMIDRRLGQELLGVWDFGWSVVTYFGLVQAGIGSAVNRYVAKYRIVGDTLSLNRVVSSASCILGIGGLLVLGLTAASVLLLPRLFGGRLGEHMREAQWVVFFLGGSVAAEVSLGVFGGVITGCHRWKIENIVKSGWRAATVTGMILSLLCGLGITSLAVVHFAGTTLDYLSRAIIAHRVCQDLRLRLSLVGWGTIKKLLVFGGKTLIPSVSNLLMNQTSSILIVAYLGPAALALYARPNSLLTHINTLITKMAMILTPTISSLQSTDRTGEIQRLLLASVRYSCYIVLPIVVVLTIFGDAVMQFWMGQRYADGWLPAILAVGYLTTMIQQPAMNILAGLNAHGRAGLARLIASLCSVALVILALQVFRWGLWGIALAVTIPLTIMNVVYLPHLVCRRVGVQARRYVLSAWIGPMVHVLPFAICLVAARLVFPTKPLTGLAWGGAAGTVVLAILYYRYVLPERLRSRIAWTLQIPR